MKIRHITKLLQKLRKTAVLCVLLSTGCACAFSAENFKDGAKYVSSIEKRQECLVYIKQDINVLKDEFFAKIKKAQINNRQDITAKVETIAKRAEIIPNSTKLVMDNLALNGPLTPQTSLETLKENMTQEYTEKNAK